MVPLLHLHAIVLVQYPAPHESAQDTATDLADLAGNKLVNVGPLQAADDAAAVITARETVDSDGNGQIDQIKITTSEALDDDFAGLTMTVDGYAVTGYSSDIPGDNI